MTRSLSLVIAFNQEVDPDPFVLDLLLNPVTLPEDTSLDLSRVFLKLIKSDVEHPPAQSSTNGTIATLLFETSEYLTK
jgi:hypothetical protein